MKQIRITKNGQLKDIQGNSLDEIRAAVLAQDGNSRVLIHAHGGLVDKDSGIGIADRLYEDYYSKLGSPVIFPVWQTDILSAVTGNITELAQDQALLDILADLLDWALKKVAGHDDQERGTHGFTQDEINLALSQLKESSEDLPPEQVPDHWLLGLDVEMRAEDADIDREDEAALMAKVEARRSINAVASEFESRMVRPDRKNDVDRSSVTADVEAQVDHLEQVLSEEILAELRVTALDESERARSGIGSILVAVFSRGALKVARATIKRYRSGRHHGLWPTLVEETARVFVAGSVAGAVWDVMKGDAEDAFQGKGDMVDVLEVLAGLNVELSQAGRTLTLSLVGHSAGAIWHSYLLLALSEDSRFQNINVDIVYLAPAVDYELFALASGAVPNQVRTFKIYTMSDVAEQADKLFGNFYARSLLYLISGLLERGEPDDLIVGLERSYALKDKVLSSKERDRRRAAKALLKEDVFVLSPTKPSAQWPLKSQALKHGHFDQDHETLQSVLVLLGHPVGELTS